MLSLMYLYADHTQFSVFRKCDVLYIFISQVKSKHYLLSLGGGQHYFLSVGKGRFDFYLFSKISLYPKLG